MFPPIASYVFHVFRYLLMLQPDKLRFLGSVREVSEEVFERLLGTCFGGLFDELIYFWDVFNIILERNNTCGGRPCSCETPLKGSMGLYMTVLRAI